MEDSLYNDLRHKLDVMGYNQTLPLVGIPLVSAIFGDMIKTTESLRDTKKQIVDLLEEKSCWELGVEPYKCDNSRLLSECNALNLQLLKEREDYEQRICEFQRKLRNLQTDKFHLEEQIQQLQQQLDVLLSKQMVMTNKKSQESTTHKSKKPFITTVRSGGAWPPMHETASSVRCTKCNTGFNHRLMGASSGISNTNTANQAEIDKLQNNIKDITEQLEFYQRKVDARNREIRRLNDLLTGGRPVAALAKDCCFKDIGALSEDIDLLQREKTEHLAKMSKYQEQMHEAMQRALELEKENQTLKKDLDEFKEAALQVESQANSEISAREDELRALHSELEELRNKKETLKTTMDRGAGGDGPAKTSDKRSLNERLNELTQRESEVKAENSKLEKKILKLRNKMCTMQKELKEQELRNVVTCDEAQIRLKSERDFFQKEYLRLLSKSGSVNEIEFLQGQIKSKDEELRMLRTEMFQRAQYPLPQQAITANQPKCHTANAATNCPSLPLSARSYNSNTTSASQSDCVQAVVLRTERERDCARAELERVRCERDTLREKHLSMSHLHAEEMQRARQRIDDLIEQIKRLECENRTLNSARMPTETHIVLLKEEIDVLKRNLLALQEEHSKLKILYKNLQTLNDHTARTMTDYQHKLTIAERKLQTASVSLNTRDSNHESDRNEIAQLRSEVGALKKTYVSLESEKDQLLNQLDAKTERAYKLEYELKSCTEKRDNLEKQVKELEAKVQKLSTRTRERDTEHKETTIEKKSLQQQISALKVSRDNAIAENGRLSNDLAESQAEILTLKKKIKDFEMEIERMKQQLRQYVQEVKKAEDLLMQKEKERDEMLEHYRSLSHDAVMLEGNNQSLEVEAAEYKRQICELESEIDALKKELCCRRGHIEQLEDKLNSIIAQNNCLERQLAEATDEQRLLKVDLAARKELCDKLDIQKDKLNAELQEMNEIRRKLERDNELLRNDVEKSKSGSKVSSETLEELLNKTRRDLEEQIQTDTKLSQELMRLRKQHDEVLKQLEIERQRCQQQEALAHEYNVQNQELRQSITNDRFRQARSREQSPRFPLQTL